jgi:hypothetical protein
MLFAVDGDVETGDVRGVAVADRVDSAASRWSGCSWVTRTAVASLRAAGASEKVPGSMTRTAPFFSSRTHE